MTTIYNIYEGILSDFDDTIKSSDKAIDKIKLQMPEYNQNRNSNREYGVCYTWKLPKHILNIVKDDIDRLYKVYDWLNGYQKSADNIVIYCSNGKFFVNLCNDHTISGIRLLGSINKKYRFNNYKDNQQFAYRFMEKLANMENLKLLFKSSPENQGQYDHIIEKILNN